jgi:hypothetical protein
MNAPPSTTGCATSLRFTSPHSSRLAPFVHDLPERTARVVAAWQLRRSRRPETPPSRAETRVRPRRGRNPAQSRRINPGPDLGATPIRTFRRRGAKQPGSGSLDL